MNLIYCLFGLDQKRIIDKRNEIMKEKDVDNFNISIFDMDETPVERAISDCKEIPFLSDYRIVVMKNCNFLKATKARKAESKNENEESKTDNDSSESDSIDGITEFGLSELKNYLENPSITTILIMEVLAEKLDSKKNIVKIIKEKKYDIEVPLITKEEVASKVIKFFKDNELTYETKAKEELVKRLEGDSMSFDNEVAKLALYYNKGDKVTLDAIKNLITETREDSIFSLMNAIMEKDKKRALDIYYSLIKDGNEPLVIQGFTIKRFMQMLYAKEIIYQNGSQQDLVNLLKISPGQAYYMMNDAKKVSYTKLSRIINDLKELDHATKSTFKYGSDLTLGFEIFLTKI